MMPAKLLCIDEMNFENREAKISVLTELIEAIDACRMEFCDVAGSFVEIAAVAGSLRGTEVMNMLKNKLGLSKEDAKKIYYKYRAKGSGQDDEPGNDESQKSSPPQNADQKIAMIMDYMQETSAKLERIENDIDYLKNQVDKILQKI
jgi:hypothetical protein